MEIENVFRYLVGGYYGVSLMDEYPLKEFVLNDIEKYIREYIMENPIDNFDYEKEALIIKDSVSDRVKLQDALLVLNRMKGSMDLVFLFLLRLKELEKNNFTN